MRNSILSLVTVIAVVFSTAFAKLQFSEQWPVSPFQHSVANQHQQPILREPEFRVLKNEQLKNYAVRIKQPQSCEQNLQVKYISEAFFSIDMLLLVCYLFNTG